MPADSTALRGLDALATRHRMGELQREQLRMLLEALARDERAPTTMRTAERAVDGHLADSLVALEIAAVREAERIVDIGAGAGFPGLPLAVALPDSEVRLLESHGRKCEFLGDTRARLSLRRTHVVCARAEEWAEGARAHDLAVARALAPQPVVLEYAAPLLALGGRLVDWRGRRDANDERAAERAARALGLSREEIRAVKPFAQARERHLHVFAKVSETPARFPRRAGMARKRPLGQSRKGDRR
jgi:16S rRNA (guanine527-N7)-methyltransferase